MEEFKFIEPELIKAGSDKLRLGMMRYAPKVDCRVLSEDTYQELKKAYDLVCDSQKANTDSSGLHLQRVSGSDLEADYWSNRCKIVESIWENSNVEYIDKELADLEKEYHNFIKDNGSRHYR